jgi:flagellar P-ring protein precursor FlgI
MVTANLPPFARVGQQIDITVSSMGNAKSLRGGTLVMTPLKGADGQIYAQAQGNLLVGGAGAASAGSKVVVNHLLAGRMVGGATVEREVPTALGQGPFIHYEMASDRLRDHAAGGRGDQPGDGTGYGAGSRRTGDSRHRPEEANSRVAFLGRIENLEVRPTKTVAKVIINPRTGSVVMNQTVTIDSCAVAHGNLVGDHQYRAEGQSAQRAGWRTDGDHDAERDRHQTGRRALIQLKAGVSLRGGQGDQRAGCRTAGSAVHPAVDESRGRAARRPRNHLSHAVQETKGALPIMKS